MLFPLRQQILAPVTGIALGGNTSFQITRDFFLDSIILEISGTITATAATVNADGLIGLVKNLQLAIADGSSNRNQTSVSGVSAVQKGFLMTGAIDQSTLNCILAANAGVATGAFLVRYPLFFKHPQLSDPIGSAFMLPLPRYNTNPVLTVQFASQADIDQNAAPTFAIAAGVTARLIINKRQVDNIQFPVWEHEFIEQSVAYPASGVNQLFEWQVPGSYFAFYMRSYAGAAAARAWVDPSTGLTNPQFQLQLLGNTMRQSRYADLQYMNQLSTQDNWSVITSRTATAGLFAGFAAYNFLHDGFGLEVGEVGSALNSNVLAGSGSRVQLLQDIGTGTNTVINYFWDRVFGDLSALKIQLNAGNG